MKIESAELKNKSVQEVVNILYAIASSGKPSFGFGKVTNFLASELKNPSSKFIEACKVVGLTPTKRQASKWLNKKGAAYKNGRWGESVSNAINNL